jgi:hypothetical protein
VLVAAVGLPAGTAWAQASGFEGERLAPAAGAAGGVFVERPVVPFHLGYGLGFFLHFADDAVVVRDAATGAVVGRPLDGAVSMDFLASIGLFDRLELALALPVRIYYAGDTSAAPLVASRGVGDLRLVPKVRSPSRRVTIWRCVAQRASPSSRGCCSASTRDGWRWSPTPGFCSDVTPRSRPATR